VVFVVGRGGDGEQRCDRPALHDVERIVDEAPLDVLRSAEPGLDSPPQLHELQDLRIGQHGLAPAAVRHRYLGGAPVRCGLHGKRLAAEVPDAITFGPEDDLGELDLKLPGRFNVENALAAAAAARALGIGEEAIKQGIEAVDRVPGRFDRVDEGQPFAVFVDYAHTPGALETALEAARELVRGGRVICVFGAGGDRDRAKRPLMGKVVAELADVSIVTSDNPRSEDPAAIAAEVVDGLDLDIELDRRRAIERALEAARPGDVVVIAGKGHEQGQESGGRKLPFDDREVAGETLRRLGAPK
jgi:UDP-N-acetylmuramyl-tripeptide synthetase